ncbi:TIGR04372 family glycosyltransferase [Leptospira fluminis]|uniref:TIGR04372 family glycosyltransferase n=1 Tax=Leptospira fluminis TaxID=2484979 RepID=A0A4R9GMH1_9LEPT|nr:TIGR04372 family glycosyltransferase [Leptospira fluminis]TGK17259.1 TIGR04372 family glycosyltransferase [Leptospira fluminis]
MFQQNVERIKKCLLLLLLSIPVLVIRLLRPFVKIHFVAIGSHRMGHFIFDVECLLAEKELHPEQYKGINLYYYNKVVCNSQWDLMTRRKLRIYSISRHLAWANSKIPFGDFLEKPSISVKYATADPHRYMDKTKPHLSFTEEENRRGRAFLQSLGMKEGDKFVCFNIRDEAYMNTHYGTSSSFNQFTANHHWFRNSDISLYYKAMQALAEKGYWVFRMGKVTEKEVGVSGGKIVDYPKSGFRSDFLDMWLGGNCHFMVTTGSGIDTLCHAFRIPEVCVSLIPVTIVAYMYTNSISIFKYLKYIGGKRLTLDEMTRSGIWELGSSQSFLDQGLEWEDNTSEDIYEAVFEMVSRLDGGWKESEEDKILQKKFWQFVLRSPSYSRFYSAPAHRIGANYLRKNKELFGA